MARTGSRGSRDAPDRPRVLLVGQGPPTTGGIPTFITRLLTDPWLREHARLEHLNTTPRATHHPGAFNVTNLSLAFSHAWGVFRRARSNDVVHLNLAATPTLPLVRALLLAIAGRAAGARVILHAHTGEIDTCLRGRLYRALMRTTLRTINWFVAVSRDGERAVRTLSNNVVLLANGVPVDEFETGPKRDSPPAVAFVGTVCDRKGLIDLRDAARRLRDAGSPPFRIVVIGDSTQEGPGEFERIVAAYERAGLGDAQFTGAVDPGEVRRLLSETSIFCLPSHTEGFPLSILEAMAARNAVIATRVGDVPAMLGEGEAGILVEPRDVEGLARAIERLVRHTDERERLAEAARRRVEREYSQSRLVARLWALYRGERSAV